MLEEVEARVQTSSDVKSSVLRGLTSMDRGQKACILIVVISCDVCSIGMILLNLQSNSLM